MSLLGALRRIENGADMWLASNDGSTSNYSKAESMLRAFSQRHDVLISDSQRGIKYEFYFHTFTIKVYINLRSFAIETWKKEKNTKNDVRGNIDNPDDYERFCGMIQGYSEKMHDGKDRG